MAEGNSSQDYSNITQTDNVSVAVLASRLLNYKVALALQAYWLPVSILIGLFGNSVSFAIMLKPHNRRIGFCNYMAALAISDNLNLLTGLDYWTTSLKSRPSNNTECRIMAWLFQAVSFASMNFIFSMTVDRFLAIRFPFKALTMCTPHRARVAIAGITVASLLYTLPYFFTSGLVPNTSTCVAVLTTDRLSTVYNFVNIFLGSIVPFVGLLSMNAVIILTIRRQVKYLTNANTNTDTNISTITNTTTISVSENDSTNVETAGNDNEVYNSSNDTEMTDVTRDVTISRASQKSCKDTRNRDNQLTVMLLLVTFTFLLLTLPQYVRYLVAILWNYTSSAQDYADYILLAHVSNKLFFLNCTYNFFLYCLSGSKFRQDFKTLFRCKK